MIKINYLTKLKLFSLLRKIFKKINLHIFYYKKINYFKEINVDNVIDVGVAYGTDFLLKNFPNANFYLIEPNPLFFDHINNKISKNYNAKLFKIAAGNEIGKKKFWYSEGFSSFIQREDYKLKKQINVQIDKLDHILEKENFEGKNLLKIDTEGYELEVLKGSEKVLKSVNYLVLEIRLENIKTYNPSEIISFLYNKNFVLHKILKVNYFKYGISYLDAIFIKNDFTL